jgi:tRNA A-37 threonylcarbamoyl transferase component Bud32
MEPHGQYPHGAGAASLVLLTPDVVVTMVQSRLPSRYRVIEEVGQGGMAVVYRAEDVTLRREVAIKVLHEHLMAEPESKVRLEREAQAVAKLHHDNILQVFDYSGGDSLASYIVTEFIDGQTLKQFFSGRKTPQPEISALIAIEIGRALVHAHSLGIIHRDIKPENVMVRRDGMLKLMDFGVAQIIDLERMTLTGQLMGSPAYMAPELLEGKPLDFRTDVFSVGIMLYQIATGALPFTGRNPHEVLKRIAEGRFPDPRTLNRLVADRLSRIIARALARKPEDRYPTVAAFVDDLRLYIADAGLDEVRDELRGFFTNPDGYQQDLRHRTVVGLVAAGRREQTSGKLARALECWNRALALEPHNADVLQSLRRIEGRRRIYHGAVALGGAVLIGGLIWGAFKIARQDVPPVIASLPGSRSEKAKAAAAAKVAPHENSSAPSAGGARDPAARGEKKQLPPKAALTVSRGRERGPETTKGQGRAAPLLPPPTGPGQTVVGMRPGSDEPRTVAKPKVKVMTVASNPIYSEVWLDGTLALKVDVGKTTFPVPWDREHLVEVRNDACCEPMSFRVGPESPKVNDDRLIAQLVRKPAKLRVVLTPPPHTPPQMDYVVLPAGPGATHTPFTQGEELLISFDATGEAGEPVMGKSLMVSVYLDGKMLPLKQRVDLKPGENKPVEIRLPE